jgi:hypothetical protein
MPFVVFFPTSPTVPEQVIITPIYPEGDDAFFPVNGDLIVGFHTEPISSPLEVNLDSIDIAVKGQAAIIDGVPQDGYNSVLHLGYFEGHIGYIWIINPQ